MICPSEPATLDLLRDQAQRVHAAWRSRGYLMSHGQWLATAKAFPGITGVRYTTWASRYGDLEAFSGVVSDYEIHNAWHLGLRWVGGGWQIEMPTLSNSTYTVLIRSKPSLSTLTAPVQKLGKFKHQRTPRLPGLRSIVNVCLHERGEGLTW